jgi:hypothetical protein
MTRLLKGERPFCCASHSRQEWAGFRHVSQPETGSFFFTTLLRNQSRTDSSGHLWLFGGYGADASDNLGYLNDLWSFQPGPATSTRGPIFYISPSPSLVSVAQGASGTSKIATAIAGGFDSSIALSATGQPTGVTASFYPTSIAAPGSGTSTLTLTVASTTATGTYPITVTGKGGNLTLSTTVALTVPAVATTTTVISSANPQVLGSAVSFTATVTPAFGTGVPTGDVVFFENGTTVFEAALDGKGKATFSTSTMANGQHIILASYAGSNAYTASSASLTETITEPQASAPTFSPALGTYDKAQSVTLTDATKGAAIYYTTNGIAPTIASTLYKSAIAVSKTTTIEAIALASGYSNSAVATAKYTLVVATPTFSPAAGTYNSAQSVTIEETTLGATIYFTTNGTTPTTSSTKYAGAIKVSATETLEAIAVETGYSNSAVATAKYTLVVATPTFSPAAGTYNSAQSVTIEETTPGATIYYTTNGTTPTTGAAKLPVPSPANIAMNEPAGSGHVLLVSITAAMSSLPS